ncbi:MAG: DUF3341 domain-containing protein [Chloroflexota bacterium]|nr:DUF3341 domain-containing protein [Chloroflexota bacterium]
MTDTLDIYGLVAEFDTPDELVEAAGLAYEAGYRNMDAYSPFPVHHLAEAMGFHRSHMPLITLIGGLIGAIIGYLMQYYISVLAYPLNVGGRPLVSWPAWIPVTFEMTVLFAAFGAVFGMLALNGLPQPYHPLFNVPRFSLASQDRFFLAIEATDPKFDFEQTWSFLESLGPDEISVVEP